MQFIPLLIPQPGPHILVSVSVGQKYTRKPKSKRTRLDSKKCFSIRICLISHRPHIFHSLIKLMFGVFLFLLLAKLLTLQARSYRDADYSVASGNHRRTRIFYRWSHNEEDFTVLACKCENLIIQPYIIKYFRIFRILIV